jgi:hypothetical protein
LSPHDIDVRLKSLGATVDRPWRREQKSEQLSLVGITWAHQKKSAPKSSPRVFDLRDCRPATPSWRRPLQELLARLI